MALRPSTAVGSACVDGKRYVWPSSSAASDNGIDNNAIEVKQLYVDFRIPQVPIGNRGRNWVACRSISPRFIAVSSTPWMLAAGCCGWTSPIRYRRLIYYVQLEEDVDRYPGSPKVGEDYLTGSTLMLKPTQWAGPPSAGRLFPWPGALRRLA